MDFLVLSHLRWDFVFQRPQHLLTRCSRDNRVFFWEEPVFAENAVPSLRHTTRNSNLHVLVPDLPTGLTEQQTFAIQREMLDRFMAENEVSDLVLWFYNPMAVNFTRHLEPEVTLYDCMDELSAFRGAPPGLRSAEAELFDRADLVFTGGRSLYESKRTQHHSVHCFPSSIEVHHFAQARTNHPETHDQQAIPHPRIGFCGVIDERMDLDLLAGVADLRPDWHFVMIGPVVKISDADLPKRSNVHYLGGKQYAELPAYMSGWDAAMLPFARNESTKFISPTKTPEYLAAGLPVISTSIRDVVQPYGDLGLVAIADEPNAFVAALEPMLAHKDPQLEAKRLSQVDSFLSRNSWDRTWREMLSLLKVAAQSNAPLKSTPVDKPSVGATSAD